MNYTTEIFEGWERGHCLVIGVYVSGEIEPNVQLTQPFSVLLSICNGSTYTYFVSKSTKGGCSLYLQIY